MLEAFGLRGDQLALPGGQGEAVRIGDAVCKPVHDEAEAVWCAETLEALPSSGDYRVARPLRSVSGDLIVAGWQANSWLPGSRYAAGEWDELLAAGAAFHRDLAGLARPAFLDRRTHRWAVADRVAWGEAEPEPVPAAAGLLAELLAARTTVGFASQVVHGDLCGNVMLEPGLPPAILDFSPYFRPVGYAEALVAVDGMLWWGADFSLVERVGAPQLVLRALIFRLMALSGRARVSDAPLDDLPTLRRLFDRLEEAPARPSRQDGGR